MKYKLKENRQERKYKVTCKIFFIAVINANIQNIYKNVSFKKKYWIEFQVFRDRFSGLVDEINKEQEKKLAILMVILFQI